MHLAGKLCGFHGAGYVLPYIQMIWGGNVRVPPADKGGIIGGRVTYLPI
ncbi:hypothetical protein Barb7_02952 [Bacteroidales bacterium Barb7]|nr:hypothetical protein Barb7_02952 [Bacteroidales bacterium Barb7]